MRRLAFLLVVLSSCAPCFAQSQSCKVFFRVVESDSHVTGASAQGLTAPQRKWLANKELSRYPSVCYSVSKATYAIVWTQQTVPGYDLFSPTVYRPEPITAYVTSVSVMALSEDGVPTGPPLFFDNGVEPKHQVDDLAGAAQAVGSFVRQGPQIFSSRSSSLDALKKAVAWLDHNSLALASHPN